METPLLRILIGLIKMCLLTNKFINVILLLRKKIYLKFCEVLSTEDGICSVFELLV